MMRLTAAAVALALLVAGCGSGSDTASVPPPPAPTTTPEPVDTTRLDSPGRMACDIFAADYPDAGTAAERGDLATAVRANAAGSSTDRIADSADVLGRVASRNDEAWKLGADTFAQACIDAGWSNG